MVAEIVSRYYSKDVRMHSFDNGNSAMAKKDNWMQLIKVFRKIGLTNIISEEEAHLIALVEDGAAHRFICKLYEVLTGRKVQTITKKVNLEIGPPGYTQDTGALKVRKALNRLDLNNESSDIQTVSKVASSVVGEHERSLQLERHTNPERFSVSHSTIIGPKAKETAPRSSKDDESEAPLVRFSPFIIGKFFQCLFLKFLVDHN